MCEFLGDIAGIYIFQNNVVGGRCVTEMHNIYPWDSGSENASCIRMKEYSSDPDPFEVNG